MDSKLFLDSTFVHTAETIQTQQLQTEDYLENMCDKKSCEACTEKVDKFNSVNALPLEAAFFMFSDYSNPMAMLNFFFIKHSKTECTVRSFGLTSTCYFETSSVQGVHHAGVAVELGHMLKNIKLVMVFLYMLLYNFTIYYTILAECIWIPLLKLFKGLHHAGVVVKLPSSGSWWTLASWGKYRRVTSWLRMLRKLC